MVPHARLSPLGLARRTISVSELEHLPGFKYCWDQLKVEKVSKALYLTTYDRKVAQYLGNSKLTNWSVDQMSVFTAPSRLSLCSTV